MFSELSFSSYFDYLFFESTRSNITIKMRWTTENEDIVRPPSLPSRFENKANHPSS